MSTRGVDRYPRQLFLGPVWYAMGPDGQDVQDSLVRQTGLVKLVRSSCPRGGLCNLREMGGEPVSRPPFLPLSARCWERKRKNMV